MSSPLPPEQLRLTDAWWRAANYLSVGQIYLKSNALLRRPLDVSDIKPRLLGHFGTTPGLNFIYVHLNRIIKQHDLNMIYVAGPGHGGPGMVANTYLEGSYTELYPNIGRNIEGLDRLVRQFSWPYGIPSHCSPDTPGSIHEGGELGYSLLHAYGAVFDNPDLLVACVVGDGESETGPLAASWHSNKFINPARDGAVLPILHLNGYKIANPTVPARISEAELVDLFKGYGYAPRFVDGYEPAAAHQLMASTLDEILTDLRAIQSRARTVGSSERPRWPMIILRTPKGWTCPRMLDGKQLEGTWRAHQVPITNVDTNPAHLKLLEQWMRSYRPEELFDESGKLMPEIAALAPPGDQRMGMNPNANGGLLLKDLDLPPVRDFAVAVDSPGGVTEESTRILGNFLCEVMRRSLPSKNFRVFGPDETASNRLEAIYRASPKTWEEAMLPVDENLDPTGRVMEVLSEHLCEGWLEGYLLTGRHGLFNCYEAFIHIVDSMFNQHAKWLKTSLPIPWRKPIASLNYLLSSHVWRQDHNGFSHQDPGFIDHVVNKKAEIVRVYLPPDANTLLSVADHCLRSRNYVNVIIAGKQPEFQWMNIDDAMTHCAAGAGIWQWASNDVGAEPEVVMACAGDVPTLEILAAVTLLREHLPFLRIRVVNVVDLMVLQPASEHPHGFTDERFDQLFTCDRPILFAYHGYPTLIHRLTYRRHNHDNLHVRGYKEEGTTTTPFDMTVRNDMDRYTLALDVIRRVPGLSEKAGADRAKEIFEDALKRHRVYVSDFGEDMPEVRNWKWPGR
jgi:xylulose-5-phosphate/fructose-6-phosphate phosphoketolase